MAYNPHKWGPENGIDSKDYILFMQGAAGVTDAPISLLGHSLTSPNQNLTDALVFVDTILKNGVVKTVSRVKRSAYETSRTYTIGFPSALWTPAMQRAIEGGCTTDFFLYYQCPEDRIFNHVDILPSATLNPPVEAEDPVTANEDTTILTHTSEIQIPEKLRQWALKHEIVYTDTGVAANDLALFTEECPGCGFVAGQGVVTVGGDGTAVPAINSTDDRFGSVSALTGVGAATEVAQAVYTDGDLIIVSNLVSGTPDSGELWVSRDRGANWTQVTSFTAIIKAFANLGSTIIAVGYDGTAGAARLYLSENRGTTWNQVTSTAVTVLTTQHLNDVAVDTATGKIYIAANAGKLLVGRLSGSTMTVSDISANTGAGANNINTVAVIARDHVVVGGAAGYAEESKNGGTSFTAVDIPGTDAVASIRGNLYRTVFAAGSKLFERSVMTKQEVTEMVLENGVTVSGTYTKVRMGLEGNMNQFFAITDAGEVVLSVGHYPNA